MCSLRMNDLLTAHSLILLEYFYMFRNDCPMNEFPVEFELDDKIRVFGTILFLKLFAVHTFR